MNKLSIIGDNLIGRKVFLRADLNVPVLNGKVLDETRILRLIPTIKFLLDKGASIILASHFARPEGKCIPEMSLKNILPTLEKCLKQNITFVSDCICGEAEQTAKNLTQGQILLLENLRFHPEEEANDPVFAGKLARLADLYVNDAFSCSHRVHASIVGITKFLPAFMGLLVEEEISNLNLALNNREKLTIAIVGGKKVSTKFKILSFLANKVDHLIIAGAMANTFVKAQGYEIGTSYHEEELVSEAKKFLETPHKAQIFIPQDFAVLDINTQAVEVLDTYSLKPSSHIYDVGPSSTINLSQLIEEAKVVLWNGPLGMFEDERFAVSTYFIARLIAKLSKQNKLKSIIGGGDVVAAVEKAGVTGSISYISTAGGAFLEYLESGSLPGLIALE